MHKVSDPESQTLPECFIIMPIADADGYEKGHFRRVYEDLYKVACHKAGYQPIRADDVKQTNLIHLDILQKLVSCPMAICDLSNRNPNVLFELGLRQAFDKPTILVQEIGTPPIFDISPLRYHAYRKELKYREVLEDQDAIAEAILATKQAAEEGRGVNSIVSLLSLSNPASLKEVTENDSAKMLQVVMSEMNELRNDFKRFLMTSTPNLDRNVRRVNVSGSTWNTYHNQITDIYMTFKSVVAIPDNFEKAKELYEHYKHIANRMTQFAPTDKLQNWIENLTAEVERLYANYVAAGNTGS